ncbi:hypothetical protein Javan270_0002 [Streptococcus phage Javan270]|nr:hypothetical protein HMPREF9954_1916 [Streptococcus infantis SK970]QBX25696.1 hypothetical protein Javan270_0002 [Streptococcus phage Javan270]
MVSAIAIFIIAVNVYIYLKIKGQISMRKIIQELLDSSMSTSAISQGAGVPWTTVSDLRKGKTSMDKMALLTAEKLYEFATADKQ